MRSVTVATGDERFVQLPTDIPAIEKVILDRQIRLLIIDVLSAVTQDGTSLNDDADMRRLMTPLAAMAERTGVAVLIIRHFNKKAGMPALYRGTGSIAITAAARSVLAVGSHPKVADQKVLVGIKHNLGPRPQSLQYRIEVVEGEVPRVVWTGESELTAADVLQPSGRRGSKLEEAKIVIRELLAHGPRCEDDVRRACESLGIGETTYRRARKDLGVRPSKSNGFGANGNWMLRLNGPVPRRPARPREPMT